MGSEMGISVGWVQVRGSVLAVYRALGLAGVSAGCVSSGKQPIGFWPTFDDIFGLLSEAVRNHGSRGLVSGVCGAV